VASELMPTISALGVGASSIMNLTIVPFGNAYYDGSDGCPASPTYTHAGIECWIEICGGKKPQPSCFKGTPVCQHGPNECLANTIESCALRLYDLATASTFVGCMEDAYESTWRSGSVGAALVKRAATGCSGDDKRLATCYNGNDGALDLARMARKTVALGTKKTGTPYVLVNGEENSTDLLKAVCNEYTGTKPDACKSVLEGASAAAPQIASGPRKLTHF